MASEDIHRFVHHFVSGMTEQQNNKPTSMSVSDPIEASRSENSGPSCCCAPENSTDPSLLENTCGTEISEGNEEAIQINDAFEKTAREITAAHVAKSILVRQFVHACLILLLVFGVQVGLVWIWPDRLQPIKAAFGWWITYLNITVVFLVATVRYLRLYQYAHISCMTGMMIGMSVGMQVGMMIGAIFGATDGFFVGATLGMLLGTFFGVSMSWCCGTMGITQGLMSGVMGGTMGSMIIVMMPATKVLIFMAIFTVLNLAVLFSFCIMFYRDAVIGERCVPKKEQSFLSLLGTTTLVLGLLTTIMLTFPRETSPYRLFETLTQSR
jgi:hypothetical protein